MRVQAVGAALFRWVVRDAAPLGVAASAFVLAVGIPGGDPDTYWHLASGRWMAEHRALLREDIFSFTVAGAPYSVGEWLGQLALWSAYSAGGWSGLAIFRAALVAIGAYFLVRVARRAGAPVAAALLVSAFAIVLSKQSWTDRPHLFTIALFPLALDLCFAARAGSRRALVALPVLLLVWTNLHGGYALGLVVVAIFALESLVLRRDVARPFAIAAVASFGATLVDPGALGLAAAAGHVTAPPRFIVEESPPDVTRPAGVVFAAFVVATLVAAVLAAADPRSPAVRSALLEALLLPPLLWLSLSAQRHLFLFAFATTPFLAAKLGPLWARVPLPRGRPRPLPAAARAALALALVAGAAVSAVGAPPEPDERAYPVDALGAIRAGSGPLLHEYDWGGWLIWRAPQRPVFVDGRLFLYMPAVIDDYVAATELRPDWRAVLERRGIREVLLRPHRPLAVALRELGWRVRHAGPDVVLLARP